MRLSQNDIGALVWLATAACLVFGFLGFAVVAPWTFHVMSVADAATRCPGVIERRAAGPVPRDSVNAALNPGQNRCHGATRLNIRDRAPARFPIRNCICA